MYLADLIDPELLSSPKAVSSPTGSILSQNRDSH